MKTATLLLLSTLITFNTFSQNTSKHATRLYLFVHGAWGGGWEYKQVDSILTAQGAKVYHPTLTGLGERVHLASPQISLRTHITDIVNVIRFENLHNIILVGHSYGGMVISGVADQVPDRIKQLIYVDAFVPNNGESLFRAIGHTGEASTKPHTKDGFVKYFFGPTKPFPPTDVPQPLKTFTEPLTLSNPAVLKIPTWYILMTKNGDRQKAGFASSAQRAQQRGWPILTLEGGHYAMRDQPANLVRVLEKCK
ncbi:alpha/beta fold hydrolase [Spirosoma endbachense]|uniref:Alpha/beta fold hydrolase n=1 Tax=Spirosoma endbachense TaxID=2666025 RepID=A0A6P1VSS2_9BACT|nr:alpha/beta hydrolase [Spirosoma endbachense]QHV95664.1 alpha/beta fold hydrolase [Spirosoma endbachense]